MATAPGSAAAHGVRGGTRINWIVVLVLGLLAAALGIFLLIAPAAAFQILAEVVGIYWLIAGLVELLGLLSDRKAPGRLFRLIGAVGAVLSGGLIVVSMLAGQVVAPTVLRYLVALTALLMGVLNILIGMDRAAPSRARQILGVVYALFGIALLLDPAILPSFVLPLIGLLLIAAGAYAAYIGYKGRQAGAVALKVPAVVLPPEAQKQAMLESTREDVERMAQQAKNSSLGPKDSA